MKLPNDKGPDGTVTLALNGVDMGLSIDIEPNASDEPEHLYVVI